MRYSPIEIGKLCLPTEQRDPGIFPEEHFKYIDISAVDKNAKVVVQTQEILGREAPSRARKVVRAGDILVSTVRPNLNAVAMVPEELDGQIASTGFCVLRPNPKILKSRFLFYRTLTPEFVTFLTARMRGANYPAVTDGVVKKALIPLPPPSEQQRIVEILDQADALRKKRVKADARAERILPVLFLKMFGDPATNPMRWPSGRLGEVIVETQYGTSAPADTGSKGVAVIRMNNIDSRGDLDLNDLKYLPLEPKELKRYSLEPGDILFNRTNSKELVGKTGLWQGQMDAVLASYLIRVRVNQQRVLPEYVWAYMNTPFIKQVLFEKARQAIGMANINAQELRALPLLIPNISSQHVFAEKLAAFDMIEGHCTKAGIRIRSLFQILLHRAFAGDLTAQWREGHVKELLEEMEEQAKVLGHLETSPC